MSDDSKFVVICIALLYTIVFSKCTPQPLTPLERVHAYQVCMEIENINEQTCKDITSGNDE